MKETLVKKPEVLPDRRINSDPSDSKAKCLFSGLKLAGLAEQLNTALSGDHCLQVESKPGGQTVHGLFHGLHVEEAFKNLNAINLPKQKPTVVTVSRYLDEWVSDNYPDPKTAEGRTRAGYEAYIRDYIKPQLGDIPLTELNPHRTRQFVNWLKNEAISPKTHKRLNQVTQAHVCACLSKALNDAVIDELIPRSPLLVKVPLPRSSQIPEPYDMAEFNELLAAKDMPDYSFIATVGLTGAPPGRTACLSVAESRFPKRVSVDQPELGMSHAGHERHQDPSSQIDTSPRASSKYPRGPL